MGVGLVRSLQPPDILWIHWRVYNSLANTSKWVLLLPPSDAYVRSFLYLHYTLIKTLLHKSSEWSSLISGPGFNSSPPEARNPDNFAWFSNNVWMSSCLFKLYAEYIMRSAQLDEVEAEIMIAGRNINNLRYAEDTTLMAESEEELKSPLMKVKEEGETSGLNSTLRKWSSWHLVPSLHSKLMGKQWKLWETLFPGFQNHCRRLLKPWNYKMLARLKKSNDKPRQNF